MKKQLIWMTAVCFVFLAGCTQVIDLTEEDEDIIAEYAAGELIYQYKVSKGLIEIEPPTMPTEAATEEPTQEETTAAEPAKEVSDMIPPLVKKDETETTAAPEGETTGAEGTTNPADPTEPDGPTMPVNPTRPDEPTKPVSDIHVSSNIGSDVGMASLMQALQVSGVEISVLGYTVEDRYPTEAYALSVEADAGHKLLVVEYDVWNSEDADIVMEIHPDDATIKAVINGTESIRSYRTMLKSDLLNMNGMKFAPGEAKVGVLMFRISDEQAENITSVQVKATAK